MTNEKFRNGYRKIIGMGKNSVDVANSFVKSLKQSDTLNGTKQSAASAVERSQVNQKGIWSYSDFHVA